MSIVNGLKSLVLNLAKGLHLKSEDYCDIVNIYNKDTLVFDDGSMCSILQFNGFESVVTWADLEVIFDIMAVDLNELFIHNGYEMIVRFSREEADNARLAKVIDNKKKTVRRLGLDLGFILDEEYNTFADTIFKEHCYIALITKPTALDKLDKEIAEKKKPIDYVIEDGMQINVGESNLYGKHMAFVEKVLNTLDNPEFFINVEKLNVVEVLRLIREQVQLDGSSDEWLPDMLISDLKFYDLPSNFKNGVRMPFLPEKDDVSHIVPVSLSHQLMSRGFLSPSPKLPSNTVKYGDHNFLSTMTTTMPKVCLPFNELFTMLNKVQAIDEQGEMSPIPYAFTLKLSSAQKMGVKEMIGGFIASFGESNRLILETLKELHQLSDTYAVVGVQMSMMTWAEDTELGIESLKERYLRLCNAFESWGGLTLQHFSGDNIKQWRNNIVGLSRYNNAPMSLAPLGQALRFMPIQRPLSPFDKMGSVSYRSVDGRYTPYELISDVTSDQHTIILGTKGSGKSVFLSNLVKEHIANPKNQLLPKILFVDVGFSSGGVVDLIKNALPKEQRHRASATSLKNSSQTAINFFDIKAGLKTPTDSERKMTSAFLELLLTPKERPLGLDGMSSLVPMLVDEAYRLYLGNDDDSRPKLFSVSNNKELADLLIDLRPFDFEVQERVTATGGIIREIVPSSFPQVTCRDLANILQEIANNASTPELKYKYWRARDLAWRLAMPILSDLIGIIQDGKEIKAVFRHKLETGDLFIERAIQSIQTAVKQYPCFANTTTFDVDSSDIAMIDLQEVIDKNNAQHNSLFYQICLNIFGHNFKFQDGEMDRCVPDIYKNYYKDWDKMIQTVHKVMLIDEFANIQNAPVAMLNIEKAGLEFRKHGMKMILASQQSTHFRFDTGTRVINLLTTANYCICLSPPTNEDLKFLVNTYEIPDNVAKEFSNIRFKPNLGSVFYMFVAGKDKHFHLFLNSKIGTQFLWACNTHPTDRAIRSVMLEVASSQKECISALAYYFGSSAQKILKKELEKIDNMRTSDQEKLRLSNEMYERTAKKALDEYRSWEAKIRADEKYYGKNVLDEAIDL